MKRLLILLLLCLSALFPQAIAETLDWSGQTWEVRHDGQWGTYGPGPNWFQGQGVSVDDKGRLHMTIKQDETGRWQCPELITQKRLGFGEYKWDIVGVVDPDTGKIIGIQNLDRNAVLGLFPYPPQDIGPYGTHEMDIELSYWTNTPEQYPYFMNWSTYKTYVVSTPMIVTPEQQTWRGGVYPVGFKSNNPQTHSFYRTKNSFSAKAVDSWTGTPLASVADTTLNAQSISQVPLPLHMNLWLMWGNPPASGKPVEVIISKFTFTPQK